MGRVSTVVSFSHTWGSFGDCPPTTMKLFSMSRSLAPLTPSRLQVRAAFRALKANGATSLRDAAFAGLALRDADPGRTLVLLFSDGADTSSWLASPQVIEAAKRTDAVVYACTPTGIAATGWHRLDVTLKGKKEKVTARRGYFAE
jgi:hypothetical protein